MAILPTFFQVYPNGNVCDRYDTRQILAALTARRSQSAGVNVSDSTPPAGRGYVGIVSPVNDPPLNDTSNLASNLPLSDDHRHPPARPARKRDLLLLD